MMSPERLRDDLSRGCLEKSAVDCVSSVPFFGVREGDGGVLLRPSVELLPHAAGPEHTCADGVDQHADGVDKHVHAPGQLSD